MSNTNTHPATSELPPSDEPRPARRKRGLLTVGAVALLAGGIAVGTTLPDPTASDAYVALAGKQAAAVSERNSIEVDYESVKSDYDSLKSEYDTLSDGISAREAKVAAREAEVGKADEAVKTADAAVRQREEAVTAAEEIKAANTIADGTWTVGADIEPGTYRATAAVGSSCYWGIYRSGTNGSDILENDIPGGGYPVVSLAAGQDFNSTRCGKWEKQ